MKLKEGLGWKAAYNEEKNLYGAEVIFQGSWDLFEISADVFNRLSKRMKSSTAENLIKTGRCLYSHVNDQCGPPYTVVLDEDYADYCPWMADSKPVGKEWNKELTDAAVELFESQTSNREQRRKKRNKTEE
jgi:hypothetical protein